MLKQLSIFNFQSHRKLVIDLDKKVTTIIGPSDKGKSAILRALRWVCLNRPNGDSFIKKGATRARVDLAFGKHEVRRTKGSANQYILDGQHFVAFNNTVPPKIENILNVSELNFQRQHDAPFWFSKSAGQVSKELNQIVDLDIIDKTLSELASNVREYKAETKAINEILLDNKDAVQDLRWVDKAVEEYNALEKLRDECEAIDLKVALLSLAITMAALHKGKANRLRQRATAAQAVYDKGIAYQNLQLKIGALKTQIENIEFLKKKKNQYIPSEEFIPVDKLYFEEASICVKIHNLSMRIEELELLETRVWRHRHEQRKLEEQIRRKSKGMCPVCGKSLPKS